MCVCVYRYRYIYEITLQTLKPYSDRKYCLFLQSTGCKALHPFL